MNWQLIETAPKNQMFIWAAPPVAEGGPWRLGLAYRNISGGWSDAYGSDAPQYATHWMSLPEPPNAPHDGRQQPRGKDLQAAEDRSIGMTAKTIGEQT